MSDYDEDFEDYDEDFEVRDPWQQLYEPQMSTHVTVAAWALSSTLMTRVLQKQLQSETELEAPDLAPARYDAALIEPLESLKLRETQPAGNEMAAQRCSSHRSCCAFTLFAHMQLADGASKQCLWNSQSSSTRGY
jgi:hypothetical protein